MAGEYVRLSQGDCLFAGGYVKFLTGLRVREIFLETAAEAGGIAHRYKHLPVLVDDLDGKMDAGVESLCHPF